MFKLGLFFLFIFCHYGWAQNLTQLKSVTISALESKQDLNKQTVELKGNVLITFKDQTLTADYARIDFNQKSLRASGNVFVQSLQASIQGTDALFDIDTGSGFIYNGVMKAGAIHFEGETLYRKGPDEYLVTQGKYTTCTNCPETWSFDSDRMRASLGNYAYMKNIKLKIGGIPVFWMPYLIVPLKSERQTGLLTPEFENSAVGGFTVTQSFFWAPSPSYDFLFSLKNYEARGVKGLLNYRYYLDKNSYGELNFATLYDQAIRNESRFISHNRTDQSHQRRWFIKYQHFYELPQDYIHRTQINNASDLQYPTDFPLETLNQGDSAMESRMSITKNKNQLHRSIELGYYINMLDSDPFAENRYSVHRLPDIRVSNISTSLGRSKWLYRWDINHLQLARNSIGYDNLRLDNQKKSVETSGPANCQTAQWYYDPECKYSFDGIYNPEQDLIRSGQRLDLKSEVFRTFEIGRLNLSPRLGLQSQQYRFDVPIQPTASRQQLRAELVANTQFYRVFESGIKHEIQPEFRMIAIPFLQETAHPFFGDSSQIPYSTNINISDADLNAPWGLQFDYHDRIFDRKVAMAGVTNRWIERETRADGSTSYFTRAIWRISQSYDFYQQELKKDISQPLGDLHSELVVNMSRFIFIQSATYFPYFGVTNISSRVRAPMEAGAYIELSHLNSYSISPGQALNRDNRIDDFTLQLQKQFRNFGVIARGTYDNNSQSATGNRFKSFGVASQVKLPGECWYLTLTHYRLLRGDTFSTINFDFIWDPKQQPILSDGFLNQMGF